MNAITLNLLAQEQFALEQRARDPFKMAVAIGVSLVAVLVGVGLLVSTFVGKKQRTADELQAKFNQMGESDVAKQEVMYRWTESLSKDIVTLNRSRRLYAAQLAAIKNVIPPTIQLSQFTVMVSADAPQPVVALEPEEGTDKPRKPVRPKQVERLLLRLEGRAVSTRPEIEVDEFLKKLKEDKEFGPQIDDVQLRSIARMDSQGPAGQAGPPSASFIIECSYKEKP